MRLMGFLFVGIFTLNAQDFTGPWVLDAGASTSVAGTAPRLTVTLTPQNKFSCPECGPGGWIFAPDRRTYESGGPGTRTVIMGKWEGTSAMVLSVIVTQGGQQFTISDHWRVSSDGSTLTIRRETQKGRSIQESTLVYHKEGFTPVKPPAEPLPPPPIPQQTAPPSLTGAASTGALPPPTPKPEMVRLEKGARLPLRSLSSFSSKTAQEGDRVYLETAQPVQRFGRIVMPVGSQVAATVTFVKPTGRVKGRGELVLRFESVTLPNGVTRDFRASVSNAEPTAGDVDGEGKIRAGTEKGPDAAKVGTTTATGAVIGASVGAAAGNPALGAGIGAAAGAVGGLARVLGSKGPEVVIRRGDIVEMSLDRDLLFSEDDLRRR